MCQSWSTRALAVVTAEVEITSGSCGETERTCPTGVENCRRLVSEQKARDLEGTKNISVASYPTHTNEIRKNRDGEIASLRKQEDPRRERRATKGVPLVRAWSPLAARARINVQSVGQKKRYKSPATRSMPAQALPPLRKSTQCMERKSRSN